ncbi:MAG: MFS-type efflux pump ArsJ specific for 1-arseno-3-phosphoglycerate, partial [uncultured Lysobacter sp.]
ACAPVAAGAAVPGRHRQLLGVHAHRWRAAHARGAAFPRAGLQPVAGGDAVRVLRGVRRCHQSVRWLAGCAHRFEPHDEPGPGAAGRCAVDAGGALYVAHDHVGDGRAGAVGHCERPQQDEREEQHQAARAGRCPGHAVPLGGRAHGLEERTQGRGVFPRRRAADVAGLSHGDRADGGLLAAGVAGKPDAAPAGSGHCEAQAEIPRAAVEKPCDQRAVGGAAVPVRCARCLVRGCAAGVSGAVAGLGFLAGRRLSCGVGDRLRRGAVAGAVDYPTCARVGARWPRGVRMGTRADGSAGADGARARARVRCAVGAGGWAGAVRRAVCDQLRAAQLPHRQLRGRGRRFAGRGLLLHGERAGPAARHGAVGLGVPARGHRRVPGSLGCTAGGRGGGVGRTSAPSHGRL